MTGGLNTVQSTPPPALQVGQLQGNVQKGAGSTAIQQRWVGRSLCAPRAAMLHMQADS